jgi:citrate synthase
VARDARDSETKIARPRQSYTGERERDYVPIDEREKRGRAAQARGFTSAVNPAS